MRRIVGIEYELKFRATADALSAIAQMYAQCPRQQFQMQTTYYDTPTGALSARHYTLRQRLENGTRVCTLKTPAAGISRNEFELVCDDLVLAAEQFCRMGAPEDFALLIRDGLIPVCGAEFTRIAISLELEDAVVELALDSGILTGGGQIEPLCEVEVELKSGTKEGADLFSSILADEYSLILEDKSKFRRAFALYQEGESV